MSEETLNLLATLVSTEFTSGSWLSFYSFGVALSSQCRAQRAQHLKGHYHTPYHLDLPKYRAPEMLCSSEGESATFLRVIQGNKFEQLFNLLLTTGLRPSEAVGLKWSDLDLTNNTLSVNRTLSRVDKAWIFEPPKTRKSKRTIDIPAGLSDLLQQLEPNPGLVFRNDVGEPLGLRSVISDYFKPALEKAGIKPETRLYDLRHTCATLLLLGGDSNDQLHIKLISEYLGNANINITLDTYSHVLPGMHKRVAAKMESMMYAPEIDDESEQENALYN